MKKTFIVASLLLFVGTLHAQEKRINFYSSYVFDDSFDSYYSNTDYFHGKVKGGYQWGAGIEFQVKEDYGVELLYYRQDTQATAEFYSGINNVRNFDLGVSYALLGINRYIKKDKVEPYGGLLIGAAFMNNKNPLPGDQTTSITKFAVGFRLGANVWLSDRVALKLQAQFLSAVQGFGGGFYVGTGGTGAGVSTYSSITQLGLGGGLSFKLGQ